VYWDHPDLTITAQYQRDLPDGPGSNLWWCGGRTYDADGRELMYLHFHKMKNRMHAINFGYEDSPATFMINRAGVQCVARNAGEREQRVRRRIGGR
jgi:hypothetical protein